MKKVFFFTMLMFFVSNLFAQDVNDIKKSIERIVKLQNLEAPATCKCEKINALAQESAKIAETLKTNAILLHKYYYNLNGKNEEGNEDANVVKPTANELIVLSTNIKNEAEALKKANELLPDATKELKDVKNPMQLKSAKKSYDYSQQVLQLAIEENTAEIKMIAEMIEQAGK